MSDDPVIDLLARTNVGQNFLKFIHAHGGYRIHGSIETIRTNSVRIFHGPIATEILLQLQFFFVERKAVFCTAVRSLSESQSTQHDLVLHPFEPYPQKGFGSRLTDEGTHVALGVAHKRLIFRSPMNAPFSSPRPPIFAV